MLLGKKRIFKLMCKQDGRWEEEAVLEQKIPWSQARIEYDLESKCEAAQLREYITDREGNEKYVKAHWTKTIKKKKLGLEEYALGTLSMLQQIAQICDMIKQFTGDKSSLDRVMETLIMSMVNQRMQIMHSKQTQPDVAEVPNEAVEAVEEEAEAVAEVKPCEKCEKKAKEYFDKVVGDAAG